MGYGIGCGEMVCGHPGECGRKMDLAVMGQLCASIWESLVGERIRLWWGSCVRGPHCGHAWEPACVHAFGNLRA